MDFKRIAAGIILILITLTGLGQYIDYYNIDNSSNGAVVFSGSSNYVGQSFTCSVSDTLYSVVFVHYRSGTGGNPPGSAYAKIYAHTGTYGTSSKPTGSALATSDAYDVTTLNASGNTFVEYIFSGANKIKLNASTYYCISVYYNYGDASNRLGIRLDNTSPSHSGNWFNGVDEITWTANPTEDRDLIFYVYGTTQIKKIAGVLDANTKKVAGVADANIKKISGKTK